MQARGATPASGPEVPRNALTRCGNLAAGMSAPVRRPFSRDTDRRAHDVLCSWPADRRQSLCRQRASEPRGVGAVEAIVSSDDRRQLNAAALDRTSRDCSLMICATFHDPFG